MNLETLIREYFSSIAFLLNVKRKKTNKPTIFFKIGIITIRGISIEHDKAKKKDYHLHISGLCLRIRLNWWNHIKLILAQKISKKWSHVYVDGLL